MTGRDIASDEIPDPNVFMMCEQLSTDALSPLPDGYTIRSSRPDELGNWKKCSRGT